MAFQYSIAQPPAVASTNTFTALGEINVATGLTMCLDAGVAASYTSGQKWLDLTAGGYDFFRGADVAAAGDDPTFNGVAGTQSLSEYWSLDGGDFFRYDTTSETWMDGLHKDSATWSFALWAYIPSGVTATLFGTSGGVGIGTGVTLAVSSGVPAVTLFVYNGGAMVFNTASTLNSSHTNRWNFIAGVINESANTSTLFRDGSNNPGTCTYSSPSAAAASQKFEIGAYGNANTPAGNLTRIANLSMWAGTALNAGQINAIFQATRIKFGV